MSDDKEEPMEVESSNNDIQPLKTSYDKPAEAPMLPSQNEDEALLTLTLKWLQPELPQKSKMTLEKLLQTWFNRRKVIADCSVTKASGGRDGSVLIKIKPVPALSELQTLSGETLSNKDGKIVKILSVSLTPPNLKTQIPEDASMDLPPSSVSEPPQDVRVKEQSSCSSSAAVSTAGEDTWTCPVPVGHFWYVSHIYKEEIKRIERENGVKISAEVKVTFEADQKGGKPDYAFSGFINLVQKCLGESDGSIIPLKSIDPEEWRDTLKIIQKNENKLLLTLNSEEMIVCGPRQSQDLIKKTLNTSQKTLTNTNTSVGESTWASQDIVQKIEMSIKDPLADAGLTMEKSYWRLLTTSFSEGLANIIAKFGVDFKESDIRQGKVIIKACYKRSGGNASMESHAVRALLNLYQKSATSPMNLTPHYNGSALNGAPTEGGATAGDSKDENCCICLETFTNKKQLKCKHEFCEKCLAMSKESMGPICPICKDVFGMIEGDQPDGQMTWKSYPHSLPGFPGCGYIAINYNIPNGKQTEKHPKPGEYYSGISRVAYLPDNKEGQEVLHLLRKAFDQKLIFTVGTSRTTGMENQVTWNDIHHKTSVTGGPEGFGYPDPGYLSRVREELKAKGIN